MMIPEPLVWWFLITASSIGILVGVVIGVTLGVALARFVDRW